MKYGLLVYKETDNIGDDIQTYAAERFLPETDYYIDRESLNTFKPDNNESVAVIMNAWYMYNKYNWPPSPYIIPYFVSVHISKSDFFMIGEDFLDYDVQKYLKQRGPIGCRDNSTLQMLKSKNIEAFFSGCMTLTIEKIEGVEKSDLIYCVDLDSEIVSKLKEEVGRDKIKEVTHDVDVIKEENFSWTERKNRVQNLLEKYQSAKCVITTRLHCALPCLALGTPVLLIYNGEEYFENRMENYLPLLHHCTAQEFLEGMKNEYDFENPPQNGKEYLEIRQKLIRGVEYFLENISTKQTREIVSQEYWYNQLLWQSNILKKALPKLRQLHDEVWVADKLREKCEWQSNEIEWLKKKNEGTEKWYKEREIWYKDREKEIEWLKEKIEGTEKWYKEREIWYESQIEQNKKRVELLDRQKEMFVEQLNCKQEEIENLCSENSILRQNYEEIQKSKSYKLGKAILWLPIWIRKILK